MDILQDTPIVLVKELPCEQMAALSDGKVEIVTFYERLLRWEVHERQRKLESILDTLWYRCGYYKLLGCDRHGITYRLIDEEEPVYDQNGNEVGTQATLHEENDQTYLEFVQGNNEWTDWNRS